MTAEQLVTIPAWVMFALSLVLSGIMLFLGWRFNRWAVAFGLVPFGMLASYYSALAFSGNGLVDDIVARSNIVRAALVVLYLYVPLLVLNGRLNKALTSLYNRISQWLTSRHS